MYPGWGEPKTVNYARVAQINIRMGFRWLALHLLFGAMLLTLPLSIYGNIWQYVNLRSMGVLLRLQRQVSEIMASLRFAPRLLVSLSKPMRLGGRLSGPIVDEDALLSGGSPLISFRVPLDLAAQCAMPRHLLEHLPGPKDWWKMEEASVAGYVGSTGGGTFKEISKALQSIGPGSAFIGITDNRVYKNWPATFYEAPPAVIYFDGGPTCATMAALKCFPTSPKAIIFRRSCIGLLWTPRQRNTECLGDVVLRPHGFEYDHRGPPISSVTALGLSITTARHKEHRRLWDVVAIHDTLRLVFPNLQRIALNLEISCEAHCTHIDAIMAMLHKFHHGGITLTSYEVRLIQLPTSARMQQRLLREMSENLAASGVRMQQLAEAKNSKSIPYDGFCLPAALYMSAPKAFCLALRISISMQLPLSTATCNANNHSLCR